MKVRHMLVCGAVALISAIGVFATGSGTALAPGPAQLRAALGPNSGATAEAVGSAPKRFAQAYGRQPLSFEANRGQTDAKVKFLARGRGSTLYLTRDEAVLALRPAASSGTRAFEPPARGAVLRMGLAGADQQPRLHGREQLRGKVNYLRGDDRRRWQVGIPTFAKVLSREVYPGIDLVYYGRRGQPEFDFLVAPRAEPDAIRLSFQGADELELNSRATAGSRSAAPCSGFTATRSSAAAGATWAPRPSRQEQRGPRRLGPRREGPGSLIATAGPGRRRPGSVRSGP